MSADKIKAAGAGGLPQDWKDLMDKSPNTYNNADSWKVFSALCDRRLRRRALVEGDPVRIPNSLTPVIFHFSHLFAI
jgi:hypothetical protein